MYAYPAIFYYGDDGISVEFPDLPGCLPCASTEAEAFQRAREAMLLHLFGMKQDGDAIPAPTPLEALRPDDGGIVVMIEG